MNSLNKSFSWHDYVEDTSLMKDHWHSHMLDARLAHRTVSLFWETRRDRSDEPNMDPIFTFKDRDWTVDGVTYISLKQIYFSYDHVPEYEYEFAMDVFGSWDQWQKLIKSSVRHNFADWRKELDFRIKSKAIRGIIEMSRSDDAKGLAASRYLADKSYDKKIRGRPTKEEVAGELKMAVADKADLVKDAERLGIKVVKG